MAAKSRFRLPLAWPGYKEDPSWSPQEIVIPAREAPTSLPHRLSWGSLPLAPILNPGCLPLLSAPQEPSQALGILLERLLVTLESSSPGTCLGTFHYLVFVRLVGWLILLSLDDHKFSK